MLIKIINIFLTKVVLSEPDAFFSGLNNHKINDFFNKFKFKIMRQRNYLINLIWDINLTKLNDPVKQINAFYLKDLI